MRIRLRQGFAETSCGLRKRPTRPKGPPLNDIFSPLGTSLLPPAFSPRDKSNCQSAIVENLWGLLGTADPANAVAGLGRAVQSKIENRKSKIACPATSRLSIYSLRFTRTMSPGGPCLRIRLLSTIENSRVQHLKCFLSFITDTAPEKYVSFTFPLTRR